MGKGRLWAHRLRERVQPAGAFTRARLHHLMTDWVVVAQAGLAVTLAWTLSSRILHSTEPIFAPVVALGTVVSSQSRRLGQTVQLIAGVVLGIAVGELFIVFIGIGFWQVGLSVMLAVALAIVLKGGTTVMFQAGSSAVLIATAPPATDIEFPRVLNGAIGAAVGLAVVIVFLPLHPVRVVRRAMFPTIEGLADRLSGCAHALTSRDAARAQSELQWFTEVGPQFNRLHTTVEGAREVVSLAPIRWPRRQAFERYERAIGQLERAVDNCQSLVRRTVTLIDDAEPTPECLVTAVNHLSDAVRLLDRDFDQEQGAATGTREMALSAVRDAGEAYAEGVGFSGGVVVAQIRAASTDLLRAIGIEHDEANRMVRRAVGAKARARTNLPQA